jgi:hypothetical protein
MPLTDVGSWLLFDHSNGLLPKTLEFRFRREFREGDMLIEMGERVSASVDWESYATEVSDAVYLRFFDEEEAEFEVPVDCLDVRVQFALTPVDPSGCERPVVLMDHLQARLSEQ